MLKKVFSNFLDNSLRHGERVTEIRVSSQKSGEDLIVVWEDNGVGIAAEEKERILSGDSGKIPDSGCSLSGRSFPLTSITIKRTGQPGKGVQFEITVPEGQYRLTRVDLK